MAYDVCFFTDAAAFLSEAEKQLAADPVVSSVMASVTQRQRDRQAAGEEEPVDWPRWWAVVRDADGGNAGLAMRTARTPPHPLFVLPMADDAAVALARALHTRGEHIAGVNGSLPAVQVLAGELARLQGERAEVGEHTRLFELGELKPPVGVPGQLRPAEAGDLDLALAWIDLFMADADEQAGRDPEARGGEEAMRPEDVLRRIEEGSYWFWLDDAGERVHMTGANLPAFGVVRVGPVYTPRDQRRKGYAGAAVAEVSRILRDGGSRVCLYTDQANPTSNGVYQAIGYRPVVDQANLRIVPARP
jgi:hypothetical protein